MVIKSGKLAVVLGLEVDQLFNCKPDSPCTAESVARELDRYYALGVRHVFPTHDFDTAFAGTAVWLDTFNLGNAMTANHWYDLADCSSSDFVPSGIPPKLSAPWMHWMGKKQSAHPRYSGKPACNRRGLTPLGRFVTFATAGVEPERFGIGPVPAIRKALALAGLKLDQIDLVELNEAFAAQVLACLRELPIDPERLNVNGGAIALGHPLGCTGAKLTTGLLYEMRRRNARYGMVSMCVGGGMGAAGIFERM